MRIKINKENIPLIGRFFKKKDNNYITKTYFSSSNAKKTLDDRDYSQYVEYNKSKSKKKKPSIDIFKILDNILIVLLWPIKHYMLPLTIIMFMSVNYLLVKLNENSLPTSIVKCKVEDRYIVNKDKSEARFSVFLSDPKHRYFKLDVSEETFCKAKYEKYLYFRLNENQIDNNIKDPSQKYGNWIGFVVIAYIIIGFLTFLSWLDDY